MTLFSSEGASYRREDSVCMSRLEAGELAQQFGDPLLRRSRRTPAFASLKMMRQGSILCEGDAWQATILYGKETILPASRRRSGSPTTTPSGTIPITPL